MGTLAMIGAIAFDPAIRGILVVLVGSVVLMGSIYMIVSTNSGVRVGFLISASALCGWMFLMGSLWVIYGIGLVGRAPAWMVTDINLSRETPVEKVPELSKLPAENALPAPVRMATRTARSWLTASQAAMNSARRSGLTKALRASGAFKVSTATGPDFSHSTNAIRSVPN